MRTSPFIATLSNLIATANVNSPPPAFPPPFCSLYTLLHCHHQTARHDPAPIRLFDRPTCLSDRPTRCLSQDTDMEPDMEPMGNSRDSVSMDVLRDKVASIDAPDRRSSELFNMLDKHHRGTINPAEFDKMYSAIKDTVAEDHQKEQALRAREVATGRRLRALLVVVMMLVAFLGVSIAANLAIITHVVDKAVATSTDNNGALTDKTTGVAVQTDVVETVAKMHELASLSASELNQVKSVTFRTQTGACHGGANVPLLLTPRPYPRACWLNAYIRYPRHPGRHLLGRRVVVEGRGRVHPQALYDLVAPAGRLHQRHLQGNGPVGAPPERGRRAHELREVEHHRRDGLLRRRLDLRLVHPDIRECFRCPSSAQGSPSSRDSNTHVLCGAPTTYRVSNASRPLL